MDEENLSRDENTNEIYVPMFSTKVLKCEKEMLYVPLGFENGAKNDIPVDNGASVSANIQTD